MQFQALLANATAHLYRRRELEEALAAARLYQEAAQRMERDSDFARHVLAYDDGGESLMPQAARASEISR